ncbi:MAG: PAS domain S-box protein [Deltaproteobacteria bacterium]|nr:PAS domain S-box protein [Deltaproteobacteria bacterium]
MGHEEQDRSRLEEEITSLRRRVAELESGRTDTPLGDDSARLLALIESLPFDFFALDADGRYVLQNSVCRSHWRDVVGKRPEDMAPNDEVRALWMENNRRAFAGEVVEGEVEYLLGDRTFQSYNIIAPVFDGGRVRGVVGVNIDISDLKKAQKEGRESEKRYRSLVEDTLDGYFVFDMQEQKIIFTNQRCRDMFGYTIEDEPDMWSLIAPEDRSMLVKRLESRRRGDVMSPKNIVVTAVRRDGTTFRAEYSASLVTYRGRTVLQGIFRDVTQQERLQQQLQHAEKMNALGHLAGGIAHDFSNLLHAILGYTQLLLRRRPQDDEARGPLGEIEHLSHQAGDLTRQILTFSRKTESQKLVMDLNVEIDRMRDLLIRTLTRAVRVEFDLFGSPVTIGADPSQIEQVIMNLAVNARDAMPEGGTLRISTRPARLDEADCEAHLDASPGDYVTLEVSDTGQGMNPETLEHVFEPFFTTKEPGRGTGLGLSVVYGIVRSHDGLITCESREGRGTTFRIHLPAADEVAGKSTNVAQEPPRGGDETILVVDDEEFIRRVSEQMLGDFGYTVMTARDGVEAVEALRAGSGGIDMVVMDMVMPRMGGKRTLEKILELDPGMKVIIACGNSVTWDDDEARRAGARAMIRKPFDAEDFLRTVRRIFDAG